MYLSKSNFLDGLFCPKRLWLSKKRKDLIPDFDDATLARFDAGEKIHLLARRFFGEGADLEGELWDIVNNAQKTAEAAKENNLLFEATALMEDGCFCRIDVLEKNGRGWDMVEIKSSSKVKDYHIDDLSFQGYVYEQTGYKIKNFYVLHLNSDYVRGKRLNVKKLFEKRDVTREVRERQDENIAKIPSFLKLIHQKKEPVAETDKRCADCPFAGYCGYEAEPSDEKSRCDKAALKEWLNKLEYPLYYLDYETVMLPVPEFEGTSPYQQVPFQFSLHIQQEKGGKVEHSGYLHKDCSDPRHALAEALVKQCGKKGSVIVYNAAFERTRNKELAEAFPDLKKQILAINDRMIDQLAPFKKRMLYSKKQDGSASIKRVLPAFTKLSYDNLGIKNGGEATDLYAAFLNGVLSEAETKEMFKNLDIYCGQDTYAMVLLMDVLYQKAK